MASFLGFDYVTPVTVRSNQPELVTDTLSLHRVTSRTGVQRWEMDVNLMQDSSGASSLINTVQVHREVNGGHTSFDIPIAQPLGAVPTSTMDVEVVGAHTVGDNTITVASLASFSIPAGVFIKFGNHTKVYRVTQALLAPAPSTNVTLNIFPAIVNELTDATDVELSDINLRAYYNNDNGGLVSYTTTGGIINTAAVSVVEALA